MSDGQVSGSPSVTAIIVNWKSPGDTLRLIDTLLPETANGLRFVVLENGSNDDSDAILRERFAAEPYAGLVTYLTSETNIGFCAGVNRGVDVALAANPKPDYLWLLNPDIFPPDGLLAELLAVSTESGSQVVCPRAGERMMFNGEERWPLPYFGLGFMYKTRPKLEQRWWTTGRYHGGCVIWETPLVERLVAADGEFLHGPLFMYWDEWDTSVRAARLGARFAVANIGVPHHPHGREFLPGLRAARRYYSGRNSMLMGSRHFPWWQRPFVMPLQAARSFVYYCVLHREPARAELRGLLDGIRGKSGIWEHHPR